MRRLDRRFQIALAGWNVPAGKGCWQNSASRSQFVESVGFERQIPAVRELIAAPNGEVWIRRGPLADGSSVVDVLQANGSYLGTLSPGSPFPLAFLPDGSVVAEERDDLGIERLVIYAVMR
ncbi:MAG: hypothetical protein KatS3mg081_0331 [Gemmatimonadales bacterium]|nr:MAG: hypothetical protein KatS3mg081_0331 [Gemmatimonadales bacterium]